MGGEKMKKIKLLFLFVCTTSFCCAQPGTTWKSNGPIKFPTNVSGQINGIGRTTQIKFDPIAPNRIYATTASGGLWKSNDTGKLWFNVGTDKFPDMQCASICIDHTNNNILYLGSGDPNYYSGGYGVWKSINGGTTWAQSATGLGNVLVVELIMNPLNNQSILAATNVGLFKTIDAGASWTMVKNGGGFKAMELKPFSNDTVYAVTDSEIWRSLNFGNTWQQITNGVNIPGGNGDGMRLAVSKANPSLVYVTMVKNGGLTLKSTNFGTSFTTVYNNPAINIVGYDSITPGQGDYNLGMCADPNNANTLYVVAHCVWKSLNGGSNWTRLTSWPFKCHTDMHNIKVHPIYPNLLFNANDGGIFLSRDGGKEWESRCDGIEATEIYHAAQSKLKRELISIGTQDNGELFYSDSVWYTNRGGDWGSKMEFSYNSDNTVYYLENGKRRMVIGADNTFNLPFTPSNNSYLEFNKKIINTAFCSSQNVYKCNNITATTPIWTQIGNIGTSINALHSSLADSSDLYIVTNNDQLYRCDNVFATTPTLVSYTTPGSTGAAASVTTIKSNINIVYLSCGGTVYRSTNKGASFTNFSSGIPSSINIIKLYHDEFSTTEDVYACTARGVYYRNSTMTVWQNITYNLPSIANIQDFMLYNPGDASSALRVAYYGRGVWELPINTSLPPVPNFIANKKTICPNGPIQFSDLSYGSPTNWSWTFTGGNPSTSSSKNPVVTYPNPGIYPVSLVASNLNGSNTSTQNGYIKVIAAQSTPSSENFTATTFPPIDWQLIDAANDQVVWKRDSTVGGYGINTGAMFFDNYNFQVDRKRDAVVTTNYNLTGLSNPVLTFDVAYAKYDNVNFDSLAVQISTNCGATYTQLYLNGNSTLSTAPNSSGFFIPSSAEWRTDTISLSNYIGQAEVLFAFENIGFYGNALYIDNIKLFNKTSSNVNKVTAIEDNVEVYPNPSKDVLNVKFNAKNQKINSLILRDNLGRIVWTKEKPNNKLEIIQLQNYTKGVYYLSIIGEKNVIGRKIVIE
jgi:PKD repeat protein/photosystem II stability/assembly factor-like uncharacterized protein